MIRVSARSRLRCAYCHADAFGAVTCAGCRTLVHPACSAEVGRCPTLGCIERQVAVVAPTPAEAPGRWFVLGLAVFVVVVLLIAANTKFHNVSSDAYHAGSDRIEVRLTEKIR